MAKTIDLELKKVCIVEIRLQHCVFIILTLQAFTELQQKMIETTQKLRLSDAQIEGLKRNKQHAEITER